MIVDAVAAGIVVLNKDGRVIFTNPEAAKIFGLRRSSMIGRRYDIITEHIVSVSGQPFPHEERAYNKLIATRAPVHGVEYAVKRPGASTVMVSVNASPLINEDGEITAIIVSLIDITKRVRAEEASREGERRRLQTVADTALDAIISTDADDKVTFWNHAAEKQFGYAESEMLGRDVSAIMPEDLRSKHKAGLKRYLRTGKAHVIGKVVELEGRKKDGTIFPIELSLASWRVGAEVHFTATIRDNSEHKKAEGELAFLAAIVESSADAIIGATVDGVIVSWNPRAELIYGYTAKEIKGQSISILLPPDKPDEVADIMEAISQGERIPHYPTVNIKKDGSLLDLCLTVSPIRDTDGQIVGASMMTHNIAEARACRDAA